MSSLERRFDWVRKNINKGIETPIYLIRELLHWGDGSQGVAQRLELSLGDVCVRDLLIRLVSCLDEDERDDARAFTIAQEFPGYKEVYASKLLRFLDPENYGAFDSRIRKSKNSYKPPFNFTGKKKDHYVEYLLYLRNKRDELNRRGEAYQISPEIKLFSFVETGRWCAAHVEMALFAYATRERDRK
jgi:hypothetical protein